MLYKSNNCYPGTDVDSDQKLVMTKCKITKKRKLHLKEKEMT